MRTTIPILLLVVAAATAAVLPKKQDLSEVSETLTAPKNYRAPHPRNHVVGAGRAAGDLNSHDAENSLTLNDTGLHETPAAPTNALTPQATSVLDSPAASKNSKAPRPKNRLAASSNLLDKYPHYPIPRRKRLLRAERLKDDLVNSTAPKNSQTLHDAELHETPAAPKNALPPQATSLQDSPATSENVETPRPRKHVPASSNFPNKFAHQTIPRRKRPLRAERLEDDLVNSTAPDNSSTLHNVDLHETPAAPKNALAHQATSLQDSAAAFENVGAPRPRKHVAASSNFPNKFADHTIPSRKRPLNAGRLTDDLVNRPAPENSQTLHDAKLHETSAAPKNALRPQATTRQDFAAAPENIGAHVAASSNFPETIPHHPAPRRKGPLKAGRFVGGIVKKANDLYTTLRKKYGAVKGKAKVVKRYYNKIMEFVKMVKNFKWAIESGDPATGAFGAGDSDWLPNNSIQSFDV